jgi:hypothetical protein
VSLEFLSPLLKIKVAMHVNVCQWLRTFRRFEGLQPFRIQGKAVKKELLFLKAA